jgi:hypothetical protein
VSKLYRTIKKSAAKSSVSRKTLRSAVKRSASTVKKGTWSAKKSGHAAKKGASLGKRGAAKKGGKKRASYGQMVEAKPDLITQYLHQSSVIRPAKADALTSPRTVFGSKAR